MVGAGSVLLLLQGGLQTRASQGLRAVRTNPSSGIRRRSPLPHGLTSIEGSTSPPESPSPAQPNKPGKVSGGGVSFRLVCDALESFDGPH